MSDTIIKLSDVSIYQHQTLILKSISLEVNRGDFFYLVGKTGTGKSTLLKALYGENKIYSGEAEVAGYDLCKIKNKEIPFLRRKLGIIFQDYQLLMDRNVEDNLLFVLKATGWKDKMLMQQRIEKVLEMVGLESKMKSMPHKLSGGEQQRVVIARALLNDPELILADEPTGDLDPITSEEIISILMNIAKERNTAVIAASHDFMMINKFPAKIWSCQNNTITLMD